MTCEQKKQSRSLAAAVTAGKIIWKVFSMFKWMKGLFKSSPTKIEVEVTINVPTIYVVTSGPEKPQAAPVISEVRPVSPSEQAGPAVDNSASLAENDKLEKFTKKFKQFVTPQVPFGQESQAPGQSTNNGPKGA